MTETPKRYDVYDAGDLPRKIDPTRRQPPPSFETQLKALPPPVRSVAESLVLRDTDSAKRYMEQYVSANRGVRF